MMGMFSTSLVMMGARDTEVHRTVHLVLVRFAVGNSCRNEAVTRRRSIYVLLLLPRSQVQAVLRISFQKCPMCELIMYVVVFYSNTGITAHPVLTSTAERAFLVSAREMLPPPRGCFLSPTRKPRPLH